VQFNARKTLPLLKTETPGVCVWSCYLEKNDNELRELLYSELRSTDDTLYRSNLAIALGIMGDPRSLTALRETVAQRDDFRFKDCRRSNQLRSAIAVCLLGRVGDESDIKLLSDIAFCESELLLPMYRASECEKNDVYFQMFSHAAASLVKIYKRLALDTTELKNNIDGLIRSKNALHRIAPNADEHAPIYTEILSLLNYLSSQM
jgi:HEAT repeat protein